MRNAVLNRTALLSIAAMAIAMASIGNVDSAKMMNVLRTDSQNVGSVNRRV